MSCARTRTSPPTAFSVLWSGVSPKASGGLAAPTSSRVSSWMSSGLDYPEEGADEIDGAHLRVVSETTFQIEKLERKLDQE